MKGSHSQYGGAVLYGVLLLLVAAVLLLLWPAWITIQRWGWSPPPEAPIITQFCRLEPVAPDQPRRPPAVCRLDQRQAYLAFLVLVPLAGDKPYLAVIRELDGREIVRGLQVRPADGLMQFIALVKTELLGPDLMYELLLRSGDTPGHTLPEFRYLFSLRLEAAPDR